VRRKEAIQAEATTRRKLPRGGSANQTRGAANKSRCSFELSAVLWPFVIGRSENMESQRQRVEEHGKWGRRERDLVAIGTARARERASAFWYAADDGRDGYWVSRHWGVVPFATSGTGREARKKE
jgi:hypothetical protein